MKVGIIGHLGGQKSFTDGQTVKTKALVDGLRNKGCSDLIIADTYYIKKNPVTFLCQLLWVILATDNMIVLLSNRGRKLLFPLLSKLSSKKKIYHYSIGGKLAQEAENDLEYRKQISLFKANWVESRKIAQKLNELGVSNASYLPNFKCIKQLDVSEVENYSKEPYRFCMFSRVMPEKGVEDAMREIRHVNETIGRLVATLDIYGPIEDTYSERFQWALKNIGGDYAKYCGVVSPNDSVTILKDYYMLLFPTYWNGEGMPGTIIDALSAGLPIIARRWEFCDDMIDDMRTGLVYEFDQPEKLEEKIRYAIMNPTVIANMKRECLYKAQDYSEDCVMRVILNQLENGIENNEQV